MPVYNTRSLRNATTTKTKAGLILYNNMVIPGSNRININKIATVIYIVLLRSLISRIEFATKHNKNAYVSLTRRSAHASYVFSM